MDQDQSATMAEIEMDNNIQSNLYSISKWTRFISVTGFIIGILVLLGLIAGGRDILKEIAALTSLGQTNMVGPVMIIVLIVMAFVGIWIYFLYKSSILIKQGLQRKSAVDIAEGFKAMRAYFVLSVFISLLSILSTVFSLLNLSN